MTTKKQWWKDQGVLLSEFKRLNPWLRTEKDEKFITNEKINFETNGAPYARLQQYNNLSILSTTEWKYALLMDHSTDPFLADRFYVYLVEN